MTEKEKISIGTDIVNVDRIRKLIKDKRDSFYAKIFTESEIKYFFKNNHSATTVAGNFAAKEAISKVLGTGIGAVKWKDIEILRHERGKPYVNLQGKAREVLKSLDLDGIEISISHEKDYAVAFAIGYVNDTIDIAIDPSIRGLLPMRKNDSHKGTYGKVGIIGGSRGMTGAPYLSSMAALRTGSGLVYSIVPDSLETIMSVKLTEAIIKPVKDSGGYFTKDSIPNTLKSIEGLDALAIGPGMGVDDERMYLIQNVIENYRKPLVIDADGINCLSMRPEILNHINQPIIITPHPGELARLLGKAIQEIQESRIYYSKYTSQKYNIIVVLKGMNTVVTSPEGEIYINQTGNPGMATAGSGDVLTGMILSFIGQGLQPMDAAKLGVFCHGLAGDLAVRCKGEYGMIGTDILENIPHSIRKIQM